MLHQPNAAGEISLSSLRCDESAPGALRSPIRPGPFPSGKGGAPPRPVRADPLRRAAPRPGLHPRTPAAPRSGRRCSQLQTGKDGGGWQRSVHLRHSAARSADCKGYGLSSGSASLWEVTRGLAHTCSERSRVPSAWRAGLRRTRPPANGSGSALAPRRVISIRQQMVASVLEEQPTVWRQFGRGI
jgi:hypothetical protein